MEAVVIVRDNKYWGTCTIIAFLMMAGMSSIRSHLISGDQPQPFSCLFIFNVNCCEIQKRLMLKQRDPDSGDERKKNRLLFRDASKYLEHHQSVIRSVVLKYAASGLFAKSEIDDAIQHINERMLTGVLIKMQAQYKPWRCLKAYFYKIVRNLCFEYARKRVKHNWHEKIMDFSYAKFSIQESISADIALAEIYRQLRILLNRYGSKRARVELLFKISLRIGITEDDILECYPSCTGDMLNGFLSSFNHSGVHRMAKDTELYERLIVLVNQIEGKSKCADALRKTVNSKLDEIAGALNKPPVNAALTRETAKLLLENYYSVFPESWGKPYSAVPVYINAEIVG
jgi:DNA-directed RNA polymerase specialized sigma24 family protein